jgi:hypothetical protein
MKDSSRTYQQNLVFDRISEGLKTVEAANESLESKASKIVAGSTAVIAAITGANMFPKSAVSLGILDAVILALLCLSVLVMFWFAAKLWGPSPTAVAGSHDVNTLYDNYIAKSEDVAFNNALIDIAKAFEHSKWVNEIKGQQLRNLFIVLQAQVLILGAGVLIKAFF